MTSLLRKLFPFLFPKAGKLSPPKRFDFDISQLYDFCDAAEATRLRYMVIGGVALALHGIIRYTGDADIWVEPTTENWKRFANTLRVMKYEEEECTLIESSFSSEARVIALTGPIDILTRIHFAFDFDDLYSRSILFEDAGNGVRAVSLKDLREIKVRTARKQDLWDASKIDDLLKTQGKN